MKTKTDAELLKIYVESGNSDAFAELVFRHSAMVFRVCFRVLSNQHESQDASQAVFMALVKKASGIRVDGTLARWLHTVARQTSLYFLRTRITRSARDAIGAEMIELERSAEICEQDRRAALHVLDEELRALPALQMEAVILRYLQGLSEREASARSGCAPNTLSRRASNGIAKLRAQLVKRGCALGVPALIGVLEAEAHAAIPETLIPSLVAVPKLAAAGAAAGSGAGSIITLMEGTMKVMFMAKMKMVVGGLMVAGLLGAGGVMVAKAQLSKDNPVPVQQVGKDSVNVQKEVAKPRIKEKVENTYGEDTKNLIRKGVYKYDENGKMIEIIRETADGKPSTKSFFKYDGDGRLIEIAFYNGDGTLRGKEIHKYDGKGKMLEKTYCEANGTLSAKIVPTYNEKGEEIELREINANGDFLTNNISKYDEKGKEIERTRCKADGMLISKFTSKYDDEGNMIQQTGYNADGTLEWKFIFKYDANRNAIEKKKYDEEEILEEITKTTYTYY